MAGHVFKGKRRLCYTDVVDFTDFQGIGRDPLYKRYDSVFSIIKTAVSSNYQHFLAAPQYVDDEDQICWHIDEWDESPTKLIDLTGEERIKYESIKNDTVSHYRAAAASLSGEELHIYGCAIKYIDDDRIYCADDKVFLVAWGMTPDTRAHKVTGSIIHEYDIQKRFKLTFDPGEHGRFANTFDRYVSRAEGATISNEDLPDPIVDEGWSFESWEPSPIGYIVKGNNTFVAKYKKIEDEIIEEPIVQQEELEYNEPEVEEEPEDIYYDCTFDAGEYGEIEGEDCVRKLENTALSDEDVPNVKVNKGYRFVGWDISPYNCIVDGDKHFTAQYEQVVPWYKRLWQWITGLFTGKGCLKWLLWLLLLLLGLWLLSFLLKGCVGCSSIVTPADNGVVHVDTITRPDGKVVDDNGFARPITGDDGRLPDDDMVVAPVMGEGGEEPPIIEQPGMPNIIGNRLFLFMENEDDDVEALARDFKLAYPDDKYGIIGFDKEVKLLVIQIPESERDQIRKTINGKIPNHKFIVFDEEVYELKGYVSNSMEDLGWHLNAIHLKQGWTYTKGSPNVKVAIVDDGIQSGHPMFKGRIVDAYNVFTQNNSLSLGEGHGTHTAGLAVGSDEYYTKGASGVAPGCKIMPVQVFDNGQCPLSALVAGVMYALHHDADVVNISIGPSFQGLNQLPVEQQKEISETRFKNVAYLWARICKLAVKKNCILVFAAGNDDILTSIPPENRNESSIVVTAVDQSMCPTVFTNYGPCSDISAPGKAIYSSFPSNAFKSCDGTSMAAPIITGTIALMKSLRKELTVEQARNALYSTGANVYGWIPPMVLVDKALAATKNGNFKRIERECTPVPDGVDVALNSGRIPVNNNSGRIPVNNNDGIAVGGDVPRPPVSDVGNVGGETDYDAIRRQIAEYKRKIEELEKLLPKK